MRAGRGFTLFISNEDMDDIIKIIESLQKSGLLIDGASETVKHGIKKPRRWISSCYDGNYGCFIDSTNGFFINTTYSFFINKFYNWKRTKSEFLPLLALPLMMKVLGRGVRRARTGYINKDF